jgi:predicted Na+-dependent transporter
VVFAQVVLTHGLGFLLGYQLCKRLGFEPKVNRTVSIEVGMQSSVMALALATKHFADVSSQLPCALSAVVSRLLGTKNLNTRTQRTVREAQGHLFYPPTKGTMSLSQVMNVMGAGLAFFFRWRARQKHDSR